MTLCVKPGSVLTRRVSGAVAGPAPGPGLALGLRPCRARSRAPPLSRHHDGGARLGDLLPGPAHWRPHEQEPRIGAGALLLLFRDSAQPESAAADLRFHRHSADLSRVLPRAAGAPVPPPPGRPAFGRPDAVG